MTASVLINAFRVPPEREGEFLRLWEAADAILRREKCYLSTRLHRASSVGAAFSFVNVAELASVERWRSVLATEEFRAIAGQMAEFQSVPAVYEVVRHHAMEERPSVVIGADVGVFEPMREQIGEEVHQQAQEEAGR